MGFNMRDLNKFEEALAFIPMLIIKIMIYICFVSVLMVAIPHFVFRYGRKLGAKPFNILWWSENIFLMILSCGFGYIIKSKQYHDLNTVMLMWIYFALYCIIWTIEIIRGTFVTPYASNRKYDYETYRNFINKVAEKKTLEELLDQKIDSNTARFLIEAKCKPLLNAKFQVMENYNEFRDIIESGNNEMLQSFLERHPEFRDLL